MLRNYFKIAWKVLNRHKFFTFVSLFGISLTLTVLIVVSALYDTSFGPNGPEKKLKRILFVHGASFTHSVENRSNNGVASYYFMNKTVKQLKTPEMVSILTMFIPTAGYVGDKKIEIFRKYCDASYWKILEFDFISGKPFDDYDVDMANRVVVLNKKTSLEYFGTTDCIGKLILLEGKEYKVNGVVENVSISKMYSFSDVYVPITTSNEDFSIPKIEGFCQAMILAKSPDDFDKIRAEYQQVLDDFPFPDPDRYDQVHSYADKFIEGLFRIGSRDPENKLYTYARILAVLLILLFMAIPTMNLININITRIIERASEIGVRKSFGASIRTLLMQFIIENVIITLIGGIIGFIMALIIIRIVNTSGMLPDLIISVNIMVYIYALIITLFFGVFSGVYPAWRMSKLQIVSALKSDTK